MNKLWRPALGTVILVAFAAFVEHYIGWGRLLAPWRDLPPGAIALASVLTLASYWVRAVRFYDYFRTEMAGRFAACVKVMLQHNLLNNLLPMRTGELSFPVLMSRHFAVPAVRSMPALLWLRLLDLHVLGIFGLAAFCAGYGFAPFTITALALWLSLPFFAVPAGRALRNHWHANGSWISHRIDPLLQGLPNNNAAHGRAWLWTFINWLIKLSAFAWVLDLFVEVSPAGAWMGVIAGDLTSVLPIHGVAGAGTYEAGVVAGLLPYGVATDQALAAAVNLHLFFLGTTLLGGAASLMIGDSRRG